jgi:dTDP-4-amino-4,6-dideoxygalactose transaminase
LDKTQERLQKEFQAHKKKILKAVEKVLESGRYILGPEVERFEERFAELVGAKYCVGVNSGYGALYLCYLLHKPTTVKIIGELHIATTNAAIAAGHTIKHKGISGLTVVAELVIGDVCCVADIVDACQALHLYMYPRTIYAPTCFSFHPLKPFHCYGDGGAIVTNNKAIRDRLRILRNHGRKGDNYGFGVNCRLDEIQATILNVMMEVMYGNAKRDSHTS